MNKIVSFFTSFPKSQFFNNEILHVWGAGLWTYFFLSRSHHPGLVIALALALSALHEFWYDRTLPGAPSSGSLKSDGILENFAGYVVGIGLASLLWFYPVVGLASFWAVVATLLGIGIYQTKHRG